MSDENGNGHAPPSSIETESAVLGALLVNGDLITQVAGDLEPRDFYGRANEEIYRAMLDLQAIGDPIDPITVANYLVGAGRLDDIGGRKYLGELALAAPLAATERLASWGCIIKDKALLRAQIRMCSDVSKEAYEHADAAELLASSTDRLARLSMRARKDGRVSLEELATNVFDDIFSRCETGPRGILSGIGAVDSLTYGFQPGELIVIAARPSIGKTAFGISIADNMASKEKRVAFFSMEMTKESVTERFFCRLGRIPGDALKSGKLDAEQGNKLAQAYGRFMELPIVPLDMSRLSVMQIRAELEKLKAAGTPADIVIIDYLQLMSLPDSDTTALAFAEVARGLKDMAKELKLPVIVLSQIKREVETRQNKRPLMSDIKESGGVEEAADLIIGLYRESYYNKEFDRPDVAEAIVLKQRNGPVGTAYIQFVPEYASFFDLENEYIPSSQAAAPPRKGRKPPTDDYYRDN